MPILIEKIELSYPLNMLPLYSGGGTWHGVAKSNQGHLDEPNGGGPRKLDNAIS
jgi:hypothetical protein